MKDHNMKHCRIFPVQSISQVFFDWTINKVYRVKQSGTYENGSCDLIMSHLKHSNVSVFFIETLTSSWLQQ